VKREDEERRDELARHKRLVVIVCGKGRVG